MRRVKIDNKWLGGVAAVLAALAIAVVGRSTSEEPVVAAVPEPSAGAAAEERAAPVPRRTVDDGAPEAFDGGVVATPPVDLAALRARLPDNLYWELGVPTADPVVLERRAARERARSTLWGRIQAGEATEEEIHAYFEAQRRLHQDYVTLCRTVLEQEGDRLPERDRGLYELGERMHRDRLRGLPDQERAAVERKQLQDRRRSEWERDGRPVPGP